MKFQEKLHLVDAFCFGIDEIPDWYWLKSIKNWTNIKVGNFIVLDNELITVYSYKDFKKKFVPMEHYNINNESLYIKKDWKGYAGYEEVLKKRGLKIQE